MVESKHVNSVLSLREQSGKLVRSLSRVRPNISASDVGMLMNGINQIIGEPASQARLTTQTQLVSN